MATEIQHFSHDHALTFYEDSRAKRKDLIRDKSFDFDVEELWKDLQLGEEEILEISDEEIESPTCNGCNEAVDAEGYFCQTCEKFWLHKSCSSLPHELQDHPRHPSHPLILIAKPPRRKLYRFGYSSSTYFICDECRDVCPGFAYHCAESQFNLDVKCAIIDGSSQHQRSRRLLDTKPEVYHSSHIHQLVSLNSTSLPFNYKCCGCEMRLQGPVYGCCECKHFLHKSCIEMPQEIKHQYHPQHPLFFHYYERGRSKFICDGCRGLFSGFAFQCEHCQIKLDVKCALLTDGSLGQRSEECETDTQISHFSHPHLLHLFNGVEGQDLECTGCQLPLSGLGYGCLECEFHLHKSCAEMPRQIHHSYHPFHSLRTQKGKIYRIEGCAACRGDTKIEEIVYGCSECSFIIHILCAKVSREVTPPLKHDCHNHSLYYFVGKSTLLKYGDREDLNWEYDCNVCGKPCNGPSYICLECKCGFHLECIPIPQIVFKPDSHMHSLALREPLVAAEDEDNLKEYYCFACERERNPKYYAYHCDQCPYEAHIECMVSQFVDDDYYNSAPTSHNVDEIKDVVEYPTIAEYGVPRCRKQLEIGDFSNNHILVCHEISDWKRCYACKIEDLGLAYTCEFCNISFHRVCAELPPKIRHNLHLLHPLIFSKNSIFQYYKCDGCATISYSDEYYKCEECKFILDIKCASIKDKCQILEERDNNAIISHFSHKHKLLLVNCLEDLGARCHVCLLCISGPTYCCLECHFFIQVSCSKVERVMHKNPFHPQHPLEWTEPNSEPRCNACLLTCWNAFVYYCSECSFFIHYACSRYLSSTFKYKNHKHSLFYFVANDLRNMAMAHGILPEFLCNVCKNDCYESFYRCLECDLNLHLQCMALPQKVKGAFHMHPVTLMDSVVQAYFEEQYCYACEDIRNPGHAVYSCEECVYIAHIGCLLDGADDSLQIFPSTIAFPQSENFRREFVETSGKVDYEIVLLNDFVKESKKEPPAIVEVDRQIEFLEQEMKSPRSN